MTITLPLHPREEARLLAVAQARGLSPDALLRQAVDLILAEAGDSGVGKKPTRSLRGLLSKYGLPQPPRKSTRTGRRCSQISRAPTSDDYRSRRHTRGNLVPLLRSIAPLKVAGERRLGIHRRYHSQRRSDRRLGYQPRGDGVPD